MIETGLAFFVANAMVLYGLTASWGRASVSTPRRLVPSTFHSGKSGSPFSSQGRNWPPKGQGDVETYIGSADPIPLDSRVSDEPEDPYAIQATTTIEQTRAVV